jgi:hypothetical protein
MSGPAYPIIKRKRVPRGVERLRDRRWPKRPAPEVLAQVVQHAANAEKDRTEDNEGNEAEVRSSKSEVRNIGKPFQPRSKG